VYIATDPKLNIRKILRDVYMDWGSKEHRELLCRFFIETHKPFSPEELPWPDLDEATVEKLTKFLIWDYAVHTDVRFLIS
jgi:hypothetical protein